MSVAYTFFAYYDAKFINIYAKQNNVLFIYTYRQHCSITIRKLIQNTINSYSLVIYNP